MVETHLNPTPRHANPVTTHPSCRLWPYHPLTNPGFRRCAYPRRTLPGWTVGRGCLVFSLAHYLMARPQRLLLRGLLIFRAFSPRFPFSSFPPHPPRYNFPFLTPSFYFYFPPLRVLY